MTNTQEKRRSEKIAHRRNVISAAYTYHNIDWITLTRLANEFHVSENTISEWIIEAIAEGYIKSKEMCLTLCKKHVSEYEAFHLISNSSLRGKYSEAFRTIGLTVSA